MEHVASLFRAQVVELHPPAASLYATTPTQVGRGRLFPPPACLLAALPTDRPTDREAAAPWADTAPPVNEPWGGREGGRQARDAGLLVVWLLLLHQDHVAVLVKEGSGELLLSIKASGKVPVSQLLQDAQAALPSL